MQVAKTERDWDLALFLNATQRVSTVSTAWRSIALQTEWCNMRSGRALLWLSGAVAAATELVGAADAEEEPQKSKQAETIL